MPSSAPRPARRPSARAERMRRAVSITSLLLCAPLGACSVSHGGEAAVDAAPEPDEPPAPSPAPARVEPTACRFAVPRSVEGTAFRCLDLIVPENRERADTKTIAVHAIVFRGKEGGTPTVELNGGPGGSAEFLAQALSVSAPSIMAEYGRFLELGDLVLFDQRGTGRSTPRLSCDLQASPRECARTLEERGVDVTGYVTSEIADDVHDLAAALGASKINLHGISYGTRVALEVLRRHPGDVGATVIDGVLPAQAKLLGDASPNIDAILSRVFQACAADARCDVTYPNLDATFSQLKSRLDSAPFSSILWQGPYDWSAFTSELFQRLYAEGEAGRLPFEIHKLATTTQAAFTADEEALIAEDDAAYEAMTASMRATPLGRELEERSASDPELEEILADMPLGMYLSVVCSDHGQYESLDEAIAREATVRPELRDPETIRMAFAECAAWPKRPKAATGLAPIASDKPALVIGGEVDPATPVAWARAAASTLSTSQLVELKGGAHGAMDPCTLDLKLAFLRSEQRVDDGCTRSRALTFFYPDTRAAAFAGGAVRTTMSPAARAAHPAVLANAARVITDPALRRLGVRARPTHLRR